MSVIEKTNNHPDVKYAVAMLNSGKTIESIAASRIQKAANLIINPFHYVIKERGIQDVNEKIDIPVPHNLAMRSLILMRCLYRYQYQSDPMNEKRYVEYNGKTYAVPSQQMLCDPKKKHTGMITEMYEELQLAQIGFPSELACSGSPHIRDAAAILSYSDLIISRAYMNKEAEPIEHDNDISTEIDDQVNIKEADKPKQPPRTPFILTQTGHILSYWLFGDIPYITRHNLHGYTGIPVIAHSKAGKYCGWFDYLKID